jgi:hypothetical protein
MMKNLMNKLYELQIEEKIHILEHLSKFNMLNT